MIIDMNECVTFDDLLMVPQYSDIDSRSEITLRTWLKPFLLSLPIISSPMDTVTGFDMAREIHDAGGIGILHRFMSIELQCQMYEMLGATGCFPGAAVGTSGDSKERATALFRSGCRMFCIDVAHGHHKAVAEMIKFIKTLGGIHEERVSVIAGSVATVDGYRFLDDNGADVVRVGVGNGSICSTRLETGHGHPQASALIAINAWREETKGNAKIMADGGMRKTGDIVKALGLGADYVMLGSMLAGTTEAPGNLFVAPDGKQYKAYRGMASIEAQEAFRGSAKSNEGISTTIPYKGEVRPILEDIRQNIKSGLSYSGARTLDEFRKKVKFVRQTEAGKAESYTHILLR